MLNRVRFVLYYMLGWIIFSGLARIFFLLYEWPYSRLTSFRLLLQSELYGLRMDLAVSAYLAVPLILFLIAGLFIPFFNRRAVYQVYTLIFLILQILVIVADAGIYEAWGTRIDYTPLKYLSNPREMWASVSHLPLIWIGLSMIVSFYLLYRVTRILIKRIMPLLDEKKNAWAQALILLVLFGAMAIPIRGGFQLQPLNQSSVYFCNDQFANNAAINASWNFLHSIYEIRKVNSNAYVYMPDVEAHAVVDSLYHTSGSNIPVLRTGVTKPNVILIIWESFTEKALHVQIDGKPVTPNFEQLEKEGIWFSNCYATGDRTEKGLGGILSGYPSLPRGAIVKYPEKTAKLPGIGKLLSAKQYHTKFYYGGEPEFANIKSFMMAQQFNDIVSKGSFSKADMNSKWGAHDGVVMKRILADLPAMPQPFFTAWLTLSSHEPFETPVPVVFHGNDIRTQFLNSLHYTDSCLNVFIRTLQKTPEWQNTIVIISADHGHYEPVTGKRADNYRIPILWLGGALQQPGREISKVTSQLDIAASLNAQLGNTTNPFTFSRNAFDSTAKPWSFFLYDDGIGFVTDSSRLMYDNAGKRVVFAEGKTNAAQERMAKALMQVVYADFLKR